MNRRKLEATRTKTSISRNKKAGRALIFCCMVMFALKPVVCFSWGESEHPIGELLIHHVYLDSNYVFCGSHAHWGTNDFGVFLFDRKMETWTNYPDVGVSDRRFDPIKDFKSQGDWVYVEFYSGIVHRFNSRDGSHEIISNPKRRERYPLSYQINVEGIEYWISHDSIVVLEDDDTISYKPAGQGIPKPTGSQPLSKALRPIFSQPVLFQNKIYMPYDLGLAGITTYTDGIAVFDVSQKEFQFYGSDIFKGTVTGGFVHKSLIVFPTAGYHYEGNATPAAGFVAFSPSDLTFSLWKELSLPQEPLAIFQLAQDDKEYWVGTDKGVFRIDKKKKEAIHYQITAGIVAKEGADVCAAQGGYVVAKLDKDREVELLAVWNGWCEIISPKNIGGFIEGKYVGSVTFRNKAHENVCRFNPLRPGEKIPVRLSAQPDAELILELDASSLKEHEYKVAATVTSKDQPTGYMIKLPTVWISMDDLLFQLGEVDN